MYFTKYCSTPLNVIANVFNFNEGKLYKTEIKKSPLLIRFMICEK